MKQRGIGVAPFILLLCVGCTRANPRFCSATVECLDPEAPFCDIDGTFPESDFTSNRCIPTPGDPDAGDDGVALLADLQISVGQLDFEPTVFEYEVNVGFAATTVFVHAIAVQAEANVSIQRGTASAGESSQSVSLDVGPNDVEVVVEDAEVVRRYSVRFVRGDLIAQDSYVKASNTGRDDRFGGAVALSDEYMVVGAVFESSDAVGVDGDQGNDDARSSGAVYVYALDGEKWNQEAYLKPSNTDAGDQFGTSVALSGNVIVVGAPREDSVPNNGPDDDQNENSGAVYVFAKDSGAWRQVALLKASNADAGDRFGASVALDETVLAVGAPGEASGAGGIDGNQTRNDEPNAGAVYVFRFDSELGWTQDAYLKASAPDGGDSFGEVVSVSDETLLVGAPGEDGGEGGVDGDEGNDEASFAGAAFVFELEGTQWRQTAYLKAANVDADDRFGAAVAIEGDTAVVGALGEDSASTGLNGNALDNSAETAGAAYIFSRQAATRTWSQTAYVKASNTADSEAFGASVAVGPGIVAVAATQEDSQAVGVNGDEADDEAPEAGALYLFELRNGVWSQVAYVKAGNTDPFDQFGATLAIAGDLCVASSEQEDSPATGVDPRDDTNGPSGATTFESGAVYVFR